MIAQLDGRVAVVTGATGGIGEALTLALAEQGASLCLVGRNLTRLDEIAEQARIRSPRVLSYPTDLTSDGNVRQFAETLQRDFDRVHVLIHSAGAISIGPLESTPVADLDWQYRINLRVPYYLTQALLPMLRRGEADIIFINSLVGLSAKGGSSQYSASKHALKALADSLRQEVNPYGLRVLSVFLGRTATSMQGAVHRMEKRAYRPELLVQPADVASVVLNALSLARTAEVTDITIRHTIQSS